MPPDLPRLPPKRRRPASDANSATFGALMGLCLIGFCFLGMISLVLPQVRGLIFVLIAGPVFFLIHYLVWGRLLTKLREKERDSDSEGE